MQIAWHESLKFGQLTLRKIIKIVATRCKILRLKCTKFNFGLGSAPDPAGGTYSAPSDPLAGLRGPTSKGRGGDGTGRDGEGRTGRGGGGKGGDGKGREWEGTRYPPSRPPPPNPFSGYAPVICLWSPVLAAM